VKIIPAAKPGSGGVNYLPAGADGLDTVGHLERASTDTITIGTLTVSFDVRYVTGEAGERVAARQAEAIAALARWAAHPPGDDLGEDTGERADRE